MHFSLFRDGADRKIFKQIFEMYTQVPLVHLYGNVVWFPADFFVKCMPGLVKSLVKFDRDKAMRNALVEVDGNFEREVHALYLHVATWMIRMESNLSPKNDVKNVLQTRITLFTQGAHIACRVSNVFKQGMFIKLALGQPLRESHIKLYAMCAELLKVCMEIRLNNICLSDEISFRLGHCFYILSTQCYGR